MKSREKEYREIFVAESMEEYDSLNRHITELEKAPEDDRLIGEIFRLLHNLKANAKAIGFLNIAQLAHKLESVFGAIRNRDIRFGGKVVNVLYQGIDELGNMLKKRRRIQQGRRVSDQYIESILSPPFIGQCHL